MVKEFPQVDECFSHMTRLRELAHCSLWDMLPEISATTHVLMTQKTYESNWREKAPWRAPNLMSCFCAPRPFGLSVLRPTFSLQVPQTRMRAAQQPNGPGRSLKDRSKSRISAYFYWQQRFCNARWPKLQIQFWSYPGLAAGAEVGGRRGLCGT